MPNYADHKLKRMPFEDLCRALYDYNPETGVVTVKVTHYSKRQKGAVITGRNVTVRGKHIRKTHLIWFLHHGMWPTWEVDHVNRDDTDDRIDNLRDASRRENAQNTSKPSLTGLKGVYNCGRKTKPWQAQIRIRGHKVNLGRFATQEEAYEAWKRAAEKEQGEFFCDATTPGRAAS